MADLIVLKEAAVLFEGGPWHGWSRYRRNVLELVAMEENLGQHFPYKATRRTKVHPGTGGKESEIWAYRPTAESVW